MLSAHLFCYRHSVQQIATRIGPMIVVGDSRRRRHLEIAAVIVELELGS